MDELRDLVAVLPFASERHALEAEVYHALDNHGPDDFTFDQLRRFRDILAAAEKRIRRTENRKVVSLSRYLDPDGERAPERSLTASAAPCSMTGCR